MNGKTLDGFAFTAETTNMLVTANTDTFLAVAHAAVEAKGLKNGKMFKEACRKVADIRMANGCFEAAYNTAKVLIRTELPPEATAEERDKSDSEYYAAIVAAMKQAAADKAAAARASYNAQKEAKQKKEREERAAAEAAEAAEKAKTERQRLEETRAQAVEKLAWYTDIISRCDKQLAELVEKETSAARANLQAATAAQTPSPALTDATVAVQVALAKQAGEVTDGISLDGAFAAQREAVHQAKRAKKALGRKLTQAEVEAIALIS